MHPTLRFGMSATEARPRSPVRAVLRFVASVMIVSGLLLIGDAGMTLAWQEPVSAFLADQEQAELKKELDHPPPRVIARNGRCRAMRSARSRCPRSTSRPTWSRAPTPTISARGPATTTTRRCPASAARWPSRATAPRTAPRSATSTSSSAGDRIVAADAVRELRLQGRAHPDRGAHRALGDEAGGLRQARPERLPPAIQCCAAPDRVRAVRQAGVLERSSAASCAR